MAVCIPGTAMSYPKQSASAFSAFLPLINAAGGLSLSQISAITGLEGSTIQNWVKRGWVPKPENKKYDQRHLPRILLISALRDNMVIEQIVQLIEYINVPDADGVKGQYIEESTIFDCLCAAVSEMRLDERGASDRVEDGIAYFAEKYGGLDAGLMERLSKALKIMVLMYWSGSIKRHAATLLQQIL